MEKGLRQGRSGPNVNWQHERLRRAGASLLAASLLLSAFPVSALPALAAPLSWSEDLDAVAVDQPAEAANGEQPSADRPRDGASSVRQRGREAPVDLRQVTAESAEVPEAVGADPGDGPPPARKNQKSAREAQADKNAGNANIRMWPMPADSYTFTQPFGCVPQIAQFYQPGAGCPADRPVVHTGLDLAAPEGTPFYAAASGWVTESGYDREVGVPNTRIIIQHEGRNDGYATEYLHWIASFVDVGDHVEAGQLIGEVGSVGYSTGPHLHFSLIDLDTGEHIDPTRWLPQEPGTEGYRGITPRRAAMRLPAGTTAGVPEHTDPAPPDAPTREDLPAAAKAGKDNKGNKRKKANQREERRNKNGNNRQKDTQDVSGKDGSTSENGSAITDGKQADREKTRTRKRERNRNGSAQSKNASGEDSAGTSRKERRKSDSGSNSSSGKNDKRASRKEKDPVEQTDTRDKGNNNKNGNGGGGGNKNKKDRQQDDTQQAADDTSAPVDETPQGDQQPQPGDTSVSDSQESDTGAEGGNGDATNGQDDTSEEDSEGKHAVRDNGERNGSKGKTDESGGDTPAEDGS